MHNASHFATTTVAALVLGGLLLAGCGASSEPPGAWTVEESARWAELARTAGDAPGFDQLDSSRTGLGFVNTVTKAMVAQNRNMLHGSGVAVGDVDGDGWPDLFVTQLGGPNHLYHNATGFQFERVPDAGGAAMPGARAAGVSLADLDGDRDLDLVITTMGGPNVVFHNDGSGQFTRVRDAGLHAGRGSTTSALADVDGDGDLDLYVGNYKRVALRDSLPPDQIAFDNIVRQVGPDEYVVDAKFRDEYTLRKVGTKLMHLEQAEADRLYLNDGDGTFTERAWADAFRTADGTPMTQVPRDWALVARLEDLNGDGRADLFVCNDFESPDLLFWGTGDGTFVQAEETVLRATSHATMSIATTDVERDGDTDFFLADMLGRSYERRQTQMPSQAPMPDPVGQARARTQDMKNTLQLNRGDHTYVDVATFAGIEASGWTWASRFLDVDLDGYDDLIVTNGHAFDVQNADAQARINMMRDRVQSDEEHRQLIFQYPRLDLTTMAFRNRGDGSFESMPDGWGLGQSADVGHGMATGDLDRDGDLDVLVNRLNRTLGVYRNTGAETRVAIRLVGRVPNTDAIGASVRVHPASTDGEGPPAQTQSVIAAGEYLSDSEALLTFAMGAAPTAEVEIAWPDGDTTRTQVQPGRVYEIAQPGARPAWATSLSSPDSLDERGRNADR